MRKQKSTILIRFFFSPQKGLKSGKRARECHADYKGSWTAEDSRIPDQSSVLPCPISAERARMCQCRTWCLKHHTGLGGYLLQVLPVHHCFCSCSRGVPKQYSKPMLSWHFNDIGIASPLKKTRFSLCAQRFMHVFLHVVTFYYFYTGIMIFSGGKKVFLKCKFIPCSVFHKMNFFTT